MAGGGVVLRPPPTTELIAGVTRSTRLRVLALMSYPVEAAATRFRLTQLLPKLAATGIDVTVRPFLDARTWKGLYDRRATTQTLAGLVDGATRRLADLSRARHCDVLLVLREAMIAGPPVVEWLAPAIGHCPFVLDLDDPTWVGYRSPTYGRWSGLVKWPGKALTLIDRADTVTCGNDYVARFVASRGRPSAVVPAVVDPDIFHPRADRTTATIPVVGWVGTHSSFPYLQAIVPALASVARSHRFRLRIIGAGRARLSVPGLEVEHMAWNLSREPADFASFDIGLYPLPDDAWAKGKSALKSVQYLASGVPYVASPIGAAATVGIAGATHLLAAGTEAWVTALSGLLQDPEARAEMGQQGRRYALQHHTTDVGARLLGDVLRGVAP
jgi:glycosyltransferase involved in cell wall biosynthesis